MMTPPARSLERQLVEARRHDQGGASLHAELLYSRILDEAHDNTEAASRLAHFAMLRGDTDRAATLLRSAFDHHPDNPQLGVELAVTQLCGSRSEEGIATLNATLKRTPEHSPAWLLLGDARDAAGDSYGALKAWYQAVTRAQRAGQWLDERGTPPALLDSVVNAIEKVRLGRRELLFGALDQLRNEYGGRALQRVDRALTGYLREWDATPLDPRQRPRFLYFPDLPSQPFLDPFLQAWAGQLQDAFEMIRSEALQVIAEDQSLPHFVDLKAGDRMQNYVTGQGPDPAWEAFFFYRHGRRYDANHRRCPQTSAVLESIELCRIADHAPEICFSVMRPGTHILPHYGVTNTRLVMHLPLVVPPNCALNLVDAGEHVWQEGKLVMFDDTFRHEAWNRSDSTRVVLLMDCWNPLLTHVEKKAIERLIGMISGFHSAADIQPT